MGTGSDDLPVFEHDDLVRIHNRRYPLRHDDEGRAGHRFLERPSQARIRGQVECRKAVIEQVDLGLADAAEERVGTAVMTQMFGAAGGLLMAAAILISSFGCNNGLILSGARVYYAMAKDGLFFRKVAQLHPKYKTPAVSLMVQMVWTCVLCVSGSYGQILDYVIFAVLVFYILTIAGLFVLRRTRPDAPRLPRRRVSRAAGDLYCDGPIHRCRTIALQTAVHVARADCCTAGHPGILRVVEEFGREARIRVAAKEKQD